MAHGRGVRIALGAGALGLLGLGGVVGLGHRGPRLAPDFAVTDLQGRAVHLSGLRGKVVFLNLWTTWCPPCRDEMPSMERLYARLHDRDFQLLAVSQDEEGARAVGPFVQTMHLSFPVLVDPEHQVGERYGVTGYPETFLIDRGGRIVEHVIGPRDWTAPEWVAAVERLIAADGVEPASMPAPHAPS